MNTRVSLVEHIFTRGTCAGIVLILLTLVFGLVAVVHPEAPVLPTLLGSYGTVLGFVLGGQKGGASA